MVSDREEGPFSAGKEEYEEEGGLDVPLSDAELRAQQGTHMYVSGPAIWPRCHAACLHNSGPS